MKTTYCPNKNLPEWKELVQVVGELKAYYLWDQNNGNPIDKTPDGKDSKLFNDLLELYNNDRSLAIKAKANVYSEAFRNWFGDWLNVDKTNVSKVVDENGEPLLVYHGGAKNIEIFKTASKDNANTELGFYTDKKTGEKIPSDSARTMFFSSNKYVGKSYGVLRGIQYMMLLRNKVESLIKNTSEDTVGMSRDLFKSLDDFYNTLDDLAEFNIRFSKLKEYIRTIKARNEKMKPNEVKAFKEMLIDIRATLRKYDQNKMNLAEWDNMLNHSKNIIERYNNTEGIDRLLNGEIPQEMLNEFALFKKIEQQREKEGLIKIANYEDVHQTLSNSSRYYFIYDGDKLSTRDPFYKDKNVTDMTKQELKQFLDGAQTANKKNIDKLHEDGEFDRINQKYDLYPVFLNIKNPLIHDYEGTHQGLGYKQSQKYSFGYVAARQVNAAIKAEKDGVIYQNLYDPYLADNYGVFNSNQIKSVYNQGTFSPENLNIYHRIQLNNYETDSNKNWISYNSYTQLHNLLNSGVSTALDINKYLLRNSEFLTDPSQKQLYIELTNNLKDVIYVKLGENMGNDDAIIETASNGEITIYMNPRVLDYHPNAFVEIYSHEVMHYYTSDKYDNDPNFRKNVDKLYNEYYKNGFRYINTDPDSYGMKSPKEFISEIYVNPRFIQKLYKHRTLWRKLIDAISKLFGKKNKIERLQDIIEGIILSNQPHFATGRNSWFARESINPIDDIDQLYKNILGGLKSRKESVKRYSTKNLNVLEQLDKVINQLQKQDSQEGLVTFVQHVQDTMEDSIKFLEQEANDINSKQLVQLQRDYLGFYLPMLKQIEYLDTNTDEIKQFDEHKEFMDNVKKLIIRANEIENKRNYLLQKKTKEFLTDYATRSGSPYVFEMIQWLNNPKNDISWLAYYIQSASVVDNEVIRIMENIIRNSKNEVERNTYNVGRDLINLLNEANKNYDGDVMELFQEKDENGLPTGYFTRDRNYGEMYRMFDAEKQKIIQDLGIKVDEDGILQFENEQQENEYETRINKWRAKYTNRRYLPEYYEAKQKLPKAAREALDEVQKNINAIIDRITENGIPMVHKLSNKKLMQLDELLRQKQNLSNIYNLDGTLKTGTDLEIAEALSKFNESIKKQIKYKINYKKYNEASKKVMEQYGQNSPEYQRWVYLSNEEYITDEFWNDLDNIYKTTQPIEVEELKEKRKQILKLFKVSNKDINTDILTDEQREIIKKLDEEIASKSIFEEKPEGVVKFSDIAEIVYIPQYYEDYKKAKAAGVEEFDKWFFANHYENQMNQMVPISIYTKIRPKDKKYISYRPNRFYQELDQSFGLADPNFDLNGEFIQPNKKYFDNSDAYSKITGNKQIKALYDALISTMNESNSYISFMTNPNNYKLPQITGRALTILGRGDDTFKNLKYMIKDAVSIKDDDVDYINQFSYRPDGTQVKNIVTRYMKMLDDPSKITSDVVGSVIQFYSMADNYRQMSKVQDDLEMILEYLSKLEIKQGDKQKIAGTLNVFKKAESLLDMNLYGKKKNQANIRIGDTSFNISKPLSYIYNYISKVNLGFNMWAIGSNYITGQGYTDMEGILGRYYDIADISFAKKELMNNFGQIAGNIGNVNHENKLSMIMQYNQVTRSNQETFDRLDNSSVLRAINQHFWYNGYTAGDFVVKSQILLSVYHNYKFVDTDGFKGFLNKTEYINRFYPEDKVKGEEAWKKVNTILYDAYEVKDGKLTVKNKYKQYVTKDLENRIKNRIDTVATRIDGNLSDTDRSAIHANAYAQFLVMHRNFMIAGLQDRLKKRQYNYNTGEIEEGMYRTVGRLLINSFKDGKLRVLRQLMANYRNMEQWEQYNVKKTILEISNALALSLAVSLLMIPLADDDERKDDWFMQSVTYLSMRSAFEFRTLYNPLELTALLNSPSAAFSSINNAASMLKLLWIPNYFGDRSPFSQVKSGAYEGMPIVLRNFIKLSPFKNLVEFPNTETVRNKRNYLENQLMF